MIINHIRGKFTIRPKIAIHVLISLIDSINLTKTKKKHCLPAYLSLVIDASLT